MKKINLAVLFCYILAFAGCSSFGKSLKAMLGGGSTSETAVARNTDDTRFSEKSNLPVQGKAKKYHTINRDEFESSSKLDSSQGSLWVNEGQASYLFSQNMVRTTGDRLTVVLDGAPKKQLETKASVIKALLDKMNRPVRKAAAQAGAKVADKKAAAAPEPDKNADAGGDGSGDGGGDKADANSKDKEDSNSILGFELVPSRIVEKMADGNYRIKGNQSFMIGKNEYNVIVTGMVRSSDISDDKIDSSKIVEPKLDIVSLKKRKEIAL